MCSPGPEGIMARLDRIAMMPVLEHEPPWGYPMNVILANDKGGVGKSLVAHFCVSAFDAAGEDVRVVEFDRQPKLMGAFGSDRVISQSLGPQMHAQMADFASVASFWDPMVRWLQVKKPLVADFGAQAWGYFSEWAEASQLDSLFNGRGTAVLVPVTADLEAIKSARRVLDGCGRHMPKAKVVLLISDKDGAVRSLEGLPEFDELIARFRELGMPARVLPVLRAEAWPALAARGWTLSRAAQATPGQVASKSIPPAAASRSIAAIQSWLKAMHKVLHDVVPAPRPVAQVEPVAASGDSVATVTPLATRQTVAATQAVSAPAPEVPAPGSAKKRASGIPPWFDEASYLRANEDVAQMVEVGAVKSGYDHFVRHGRQEGRVAPIASFRRSG